jgi:hypothetical protein
MATKPKNWRQRFGASRLPLTKKLDFDFAGIKSGMTMLISSPVEVAAYVANIPAGSTRTVEQLRADLAKAHKVDATCPVSTAIFLRVASEAAFEDLQAGSGLDAITPFWRVVAPGSVLARKLACGDDFLIAQRERESAELG